MYAYFQTRGFLATEQEIAECTTVLGHAPRSYEDFVDEILLA
jgi:hypothetical protein